MSRTSDPVRRSGACVEGFEGHALAQARQSQAGVGGLVLQALLERLAKARSVPGSSRARLRDLDRFKQPSSVLKRGFVFELAGSREAFPQSLSDRQLELLRLQRVGDVSQGARGRAQRQAVAPYRWDGLCVGMRVEDHAGRPA